MPFKPMTPVDRALHLLEQYRIVKPEESFDQLKADRLKLASFDIACLLVQVVDQLKRETEHVAQRLAEVSTMASPDVISTMPFSFGDLGPKYTVVVALLAERSRLIHTLQQIGKRANEEPKPA